MKAKACSKLLRRPLTGDWYRAMSLRFWKTRLASNHSTTIATRFSAASPVAPGPRLIYFGANHQVAIMETGALLGNPMAPISNPKGSWAILSFDLILTSIVDLTGSTEQRVLRTNHAELTGNWSNYPGIAPTQELGHELFQLAGLEGFLYTSATTNARCLAVFPDKLGRGSRITFFNEITRRLERLV